MISPSQTTQTSTFNYHPGHSSYVNDDRGGGSASQPGPWSRASTGTYPATSYPSVQPSVIRSPAWSDVHSQPTSASPGGHDNLHYDNQSFPETKGNISASTFGVDSSTSLGSSNKDFEHLFPNGVGEEVQINQLAPFNATDGFNFDDFPDLSSYLPESLTFMDESPHHPMAVSNLIETTPSPPGTALSEEKRMEVIDIINNEFAEEAPGCLRNKSDLLSGDQNRHDHVLNVGMIQLYLVQFWSHFDPQVPILHKPTFVPSEASPLLLIAMIVLGATCLERSKLTHETTNMCAELANYLAWHLRWALFRHPEFQPPAKLWVFQALLLLEFYEKCYTTSRTHHERAHIHHGTTLTLLKRGPFLAGKVAKGKSATGGASKYGAGSSKLSQRGGEVSEERWQNWILKEGTRRAASAAFVMDAVHQKLFGHEMVLNIHEMRLPLPCDECYWTAQSAADIAALRSKPNAPDLKPPSFLDSLKKTLNGQKVETNTFGRTVLMAGLLNVSFHMSRRDELVLNLGVQVGPRAPSGEEKWKVSLKRAFNFWRRDFDESLATSNVQSGSSSTSSTAESTGIENGNVFESRIVLHHLAFMSIHVDIIDIQIFARSECLLGRKITPEAFEVAQQRVKKSWAPSAGAREAVFHALRFLHEVLLDPERGPRDVAYVYTHASTPPSGFVTSPTYQTSYPNGAAGSTSPIANNKSPTTLTPSTATFTNGGSSSTALTPFFPPSTTEHQTTSHRPSFNYSAREDPLLNRPWVLYQSALVMWSYGFALDGPVSPNLQIHRESKYRDMRRFLTRMRNDVQTPDDLLNPQIKNRNSCVGLLMVLQDLFADTRWQLLKEGSELLGKCIALLEGKIE